MKKNINKEKKAEVFWRNNYKASKNNKRDLDNTYF